MRTDPVTIIGVSAASLALLSGSACARGTEGTVTTTTGEAAGGTATASTALANITGFDLSDGSTSIYQGDIRYLAEVDEATGVVRIGIKEQGQDFEQVTMTEVDASFMDRLKQIAEKDGIVAWNGYSESAQDVLDGDAFSLYVTLADGTSITAHGYMSYPDGFGTFWADVKALFEDTLARSGEA